MAGILFIISAPSGSGKSTLVNQLRSLVNGLEFSVSYTTRPPRGSEEEAREYHFTTRETFQQMIEAGEFLEYADVFGNYYGTARQTLDDAFARGRDLLLDIDVQGATQVRAKVPEAVSIFVVTPSPEILAMRLRNRSRAEGKIQDEIIERRLAKAKQEIENYREYGYILVNDILDRAVEELAAIVTAERVRRQGGEITADTERLIRLAEGCRQKNAEARIRPVLEKFGVTPVHV
ncbi:guanylate kinase [Paracidobacterium acidisoli]|uniref:Guanylate kinase n=1 Tax=Paracidobacterium acidisoli TaxID=2303751 RepID=A0A372IRA0_9BACT|nr:guanylate kinase [Paracidobacterium acidisoli]MBT9330323.1 guanylate kinase [Paracidobacterium acidisoli]